MRHENRRQRQQNKLGSPSVPSFEPLAGASCHQEKGREPVGQSRACASNPVSIAFIPTSLPQTVSSLTRTRLHILWLFQICRVRAIQCAKFFHMCEFLQQGDLGSYPWITCRSWGYPGGAQEEDDVQDAEGRNDRCAEVSCCKMFSSIHRLATRQLLLRLPCSSSSSPAAAVPDHLHTKP